MRLVQIVSYVLIPLTFLGVIGCSENEDTRTLDGNRYHNPSIGLSLQFPASWQLKLDETLLNTKIDLAARGPSVDGFSPNVTVMVEKHTGGEPDWNQLMEYVHQQLVSQYPDLADYSDTVLTVDGKSYADFSYTSTFGGNRLKIRQNWLLNRGTEISITYTDFAARWQANTVFPAIHASMQLD